MKSAVADYRYRCYCVRIEPVVSGAPVLRFTAHPTDLVMGGQVYHSDSGYEFSGYNSTARLSPDTVDLQGIAHAAGISAEQVAAGVYNNARVYVFATSWAVPVEDEEPLAKYLFGRATLQDDRYVVQLMGLIDAIGQSEGPTYTAGCQATLGDALCSVDLDALEEVATVTAVAGVDAFTVDSAQAADWYGYGTVRFVTGSNAALGARRIRSHASNGDISLFDPYQREVEVGDQVVLRPGCRKRFQEDCITKFDNGVNYQGYPHVPTAGQAGQIGKPKTGGGQNSK